MTDETDESDDRRESADPEAAESTSSDDIGGEQDASSEADGGAGPDDPDINDLLDQLDRLESTVDDPHEQEKVRQTISLVQRMPGSRAFTQRVQKYTTRDMAESFVGAVLFSLPLLVEDGVFEIAEFLTSVSVGPVPPFFVANVVFVIVLTSGMMYYADFRDVQIHRPIFGFVPRRLVGVLVISFVTTLVLMVMWGRLVESGLTNLDALSRVTVIWAAAAFGAALGDILPGESEGSDISDRIEERTRTKSD